MASAGSVVAAAIVLTALERSIPRPVARPALLDFRHVFRNVAVHMFFVTVDAGALTGGVVPAADPVHRGATISLHSLVGFGMGCLSPTVFGAVLDLAGGRGEVMAWGFAFASLGLVALLGIIPARQLAAKTRE